MWAWDQVRITTSGLWEIIFLTKQLAPLAPFSFYGPAYGQAATGQEQTWNSSMHDIFGSRVVGTLLEEHPYFVRVQSSSPDSLHVANNNTRLNATTGKKLFVICLGAC